MKKTFFSLLAGVLLLAIVPGLASCGEKGDEVPSAYSISCKAGDNYTVSGLESEAEAGNEITFDVESNSVFYTVGSVTMNGAVLTEDFFGYSFTMPAEDVEIVVTMTEVGEYDDPDDHLSWGSTVTGEISLAEGSEVQIPLVFDGISSANWITSIKDTIYSSDESVIPSDAVSFKPTTASASNAIIGGKLIVDLTDAHPGETYIYVDLDPNNSSLGTLIRKFTVTDEALILPTMDVTFTFTNSTHYPDEDIFFNITDIEGDGTIQTIYLRDFKNGEYRFEYTIGHTYRVTCAYSVYIEAEDRYEVTTLYLNEWVGTNLGGAVNQLKRDGDNPGRNTLRLTTEAIEVPFTIRESE